MLRGHFLKARMRPLGLTSENKETKMGSSKIAATRKFAQQ